jgi:hypothetical protein
MSATLGWIGACIVLALFSLPVDAFGSYRPLFIRRLFEEEKGV